MALELELPFELVWSAAGPVVTMVRVPTRRMTWGPFWQQALAETPRTRLVALDACDASADPGWLVGAVHHMTRCGSTLLMRQLGAIEGIVPIVEPHAVAQLLDHPDDDRDRVVRRLRALIGLMREGLAPIGERAVIKWVTGLCRHAALLEAALPGVPAIFLHRDPLEVLASIEREPHVDFATVTPHQLQGPGEPAPQSLPASALETYARIIAANCRWIARAPAVRRVDFAQLPAAAATIADYFGLTLTDADATRMAEAAANDVKRDRPYVPDGDAKRAGASPEARRLADAVLAPALGEAIEQLSPLPGTR